MGIMNIKGLLLFLFIPVTLVLFLLFPFGVLISVLLGLGIMFFHRLIARPYMKYYHAKKCLWCNAPFKNASSLKINVEEGKNVQEFNSCSEKCKRGVQNFFRFTGAYRHMIKWGILIPLAGYLVIALLVSFEILALDMQWVKNSFKAIIAILVVSVSFFYRVGGAAELVFPLPVHNLLLLGIRNTLWIFRIVGIWWLITVGKDVIELLA
ncbi:MAG: hypothetical protein A2Y62_17725 [Candidatus Fischerbacteria bacterium RBG_13_37_8]|uniref:Uncharacterized protein n=1 Tax=Candidatus Fischerbacteria bacterium RBG_13_37_8 TaxID=1817863 RepID=A0A1F5VP47_9BACT|nr:MAG: hypothetical protein A2Y62_17725 [Candidatus Fischerbacteria bacterium RBG_13_37_8]